MSDEDAFGSVRYIVQDVQTAVDFYTRHFGFTAGISSPAFADVTRGNLRLLLSGPKSSAGQAMALECLRGCYFVNQVKVDEE